MASFRKQYGIRIKSEEFGSMPWDEFCDLMSGLDAETPLGRIIGIRLETDEDVLKSYTPDMNRIRNEWKGRQAKQMSQEQVDSFLGSMEKVFAQMAGYGKEV